MLPPYSSLSELGPYLSAPVGVLSQRRAEGVHARQLGVELLLEGLVQVEGLLEELLLLEPGCFGVHLPLGAVGGPHLVESLLGLQELLDLLEVHAECLAQLEDAPELDEVAVSIAPL